MQIRTETRVGLFVVIALGIFFYMTIHIGVFRLDRSKYKPQVVYFEDVSGLEKKAPVKIAGVTVGWVERVELVSDHDQKAKAHMMIDRNYKLRTDAYAVVKQEGLLGNKYLEVYTGDPMLPELPESYPLSKPGRAPASIDDILHKVSNIATNMEDITGSMRDSFGGMSGKDSMQQSVENFNIAAEKIARLTEMLDRTLSHNEQNFNDMITDARDFARDLKESVPDWGKDFQRLSNKMEDIFDKDFTNVAQQIEDSFKNISSISQKVDEGKGLVGKLINDDSTYDDIKYAVGGIKKYLSKIDKINVVVDAHGEYYYRPAEKMQFENSKGYLNVRIHTSEDQFYLLQVVGTQKGNIKRHALIKNWYDERGDLFLPSKFFKGEVKFLPELIGQIETIDRELDAYRYGFQIGKIYKNMCFRFGLFESTVGLALDLQIPFQTDKFRWISTFMVFDFRGRQRINDSRPHLKWLNRVFILKNIYAAFGADDFISKDNSNAFFGFGLRFCDDDLKYLASRLGFLGGVGG